MKGVIPYPSETRLVKRGADAFIKVSRGKTGKFTVRI